jgi:hypothetical protein
MTIGCMRIRLSLDRLALPPHRGFRAGEANDGSILHDPLPATHRARRNAVPITLEEFTMLTVHTLNDRICAHSTNAAHAIEVPPNASDHSPAATLLVVNKFPRPSVEIEIEAIAAKSG